MKSFIVILDYTPTFRHFWLISGWFIWPWLQRSTFALLPWTRWTNERSICKNQPGIVFSGHASLDLQLSYFYQKAVFLCAKVMHWVCELHVLGFKFLSNVLNKMRETLWWYKGIHVITMDEVMGELCIWNNYRMPGNTEPINISHQPYS